MGPVALVSLLLNDGLTKALPGSDVNDNPNQPVDAAMQQAYNRAAIQVRTRVHVMSRYAHVTNVYWHHRHAAVPACIRSR